MIIHAVVGGTTSVLGGGKFANGAVTGAYGYLFNVCYHTQECGIYNQIEQFVQAVGDGLKAIGNVIWAATPGSAAVDCLQQGCEALGATIAAADFVPAGKAAKLAFKTAHYTKRLMAAGLDTARVEAAVAVDIAKIQPNSLAVGADFSNRIVVDNVPVIYRAQPQRGGTINIGTIHPDDERWIR